MLNNESNMIGTIHRRRLLACTAKGIIRLLQNYDIELQGKHVVILGRSLIVGKPLIGLLLQENCTVTSCNSYTENLKDITQTADIIISAIGQPKLINSDYLSSKCYCIIDVGTNRDEEGKMCGDCDFNDILDYWSSLNTASLIRPKTRYITPVPGGVGPMTVAMLVENVYYAYMNHLQS